MKNLIIGIDGGSCSGKTTLALILKERFGATLLHKDNYYLKRDDVPFEERKKINYDCPDAFENRLLAEHLRLLKTGKAVNSPLYDYTVHNRKKETAVVEPNRIIVVDGIMLLENEELRSCFDLKIFVDSDAETRLNRRVERDTVTRGRTVEDIKEQFNETVEPMYKKYIEPYKIYADMIIVSDESEAVSKKIEALLRE